MGMQVLLQILNFASVLATGLMIWKGLGLVCNTESPIVVVLRSAQFHNLHGNHSFWVSSGSMEPAFYRGDLLFLTNPASERYHTGDITVYKIPGADIPIVHRVLETRDTVSNKKGWANTLHLHWAAVHALSSDMFLPVRLHNVNSC